MTVVAIVGGTGGLGRAIVEVLRADPRHKVVALGRSASTAVSDVVPINYSDVAAVAKTLRDHSVDTVVVTINVGDQAASDAQLNVIRAAAEAGTVKRFIVSEWGIVHDSSSPYYAFREASYDALRKTSLEWTRVANGFFQDYWGIARGLKSYMTPMPDMWVDLANKKAALPGSGDELVTMTYTFDVARYLAAFLADEEHKWEETTYFAADNVTWNGFVKIAEEVTGSKFDVVYDSLEKMEKGEVTELPAHPAVYTVFPKPALQGMISMFGKWMVLGRAGLPADKAVSKKYTEIQPKKIADIIGLWK